jgi:hypothetical protein
MSSRPDPWKPRKNPELGDIEKVIRNNSERFLGESDHTRKTGYARVLRAAVDHWLAEPGELVDLVEGAVEPRWRERTVWDEWERRMEPETAESPFDTPGHAEDVLFYLNSSMVPTPVFPAGETHRFDSRELGGYVVHLLEKRFLTEAPTRNHFASEAAFNRQFGPPPRPFLAGEHLVLCDPRGYWDGRTAQPAGTYKHHQRAMKRAESLAETFGIRFVVARVVGSADNH